MPMDLPIPIMEVKENIFAKVFGFDEPETTFLFDVHDSTQTATLDSIPFDPRIIFVFYVFCRFFRPLVRVAGIDNWHVLSLLMQVSQAER